MILVVDIGNSNIVLGLFDKCKAPEKDAKFIWRIHTDTQKTTDEYGIIIRSFFAESNIDIDSIELVFVSSVVPALTTTIQNTLKSIVKTKVVSFTPEIYEQLPVSIIDSAKNQIGTDLLANATAGFLHCKSECIIVDFGTALTFTMVDNTGKVQGVAIAPGLQTAVKALFKNTAQIPSVVLKEPSTVLGYDTVSAVQSGIVFGYTELVSGMLKRIHKEKSFENATVIATGGLSHVIENDDKKFNFVDRQFTLKGLACIASLLKI